MGTAAWRAILTASEVQIINNLGLDGTFPIADAATFVEDLREIAKERQPCARCKGESRKPRALCMPCHQDLMS